MEPQIVAEVMPTATLEASLGVVGYGCPQLRVVVYHWIAPKMRVQTFVATRDAASTLLSLHVRLAFIAMLAATAARPLATQVALPSTHLPGV